MTLKMNVEFEDGADPKAVMQEVGKTANGWRTTARYLSDRGDEIMNKKQKRC